MRRLRRGRVDFGSTPRPFISSDPDGKAHRRRQGRARRSARSPRALLMGRRRRRQKPAPRLREPRIRPPDPAVSAVIGSFSGGKRCRRRPRTTTARAGDPRPRQSAFPIHVGIAANGAQNKRTAVPSQPEGPSVAGRSDTTTWLAASDPTSDSPDGNFDGRPIDGFPARRGATERQ